ncbi:hypothetical protein [Patulibacter defluvii]|uniref:hypothetical protein n=1 Tax=Patulibacter defluvii TaxID=3095358 RepID=UPI002A74C8B8|nr:hypothetical protein [Patulibacter sp. DM4]
MTTSRTRRVRWTHVGAIAAATIAAAATAPAASAARTARAPAVTLTAPSAGTALAARVTVIAVAPRARAVVFRGRWADADGVLRWHTIGSDRSRADGFRIVWRPGNAVAVDVAIRANALDAAGRTIGRSAAVAVRRAGGDPGGSGHGGGNLTVAQPFRVSGSCVGGRCALIQRERPTTASREVGRLPEGTAVRVVCQATGATVATIGGRSSVWDQLLDGSWVSDLYLSTSGRDGFTAGLPRC